MFDQSLNPEKMTTRQIHQALELLLGVEEEEHRKDLNEIFEKKIMITGQGGRGKTSGAVCIAYDLKEETNRPVIAVGTKVGLIPETFGEFKEISTEDFIDQLKRINAATGSSAEMENAQQVYDVMKAHGVDLYGAIVIFDEAVELFNSARRDKLVLVTTAFFAKARHFYITPIILAPSENEIDIRVRDQVQWKGTCFYHEYKEKLFVHLKCGMRNITFEWNMEEAILKPSYHSMFRTRNPISFRPSSLEKIKI